jgi:hypothetical protein
MPKYLVKDMKIFMEQANALSDGGKNEVIYCPAWQTAYPKFEDFAVGINFEHLKTKDKDGLPLLFADYVKWADCICNFDVHGNEEIARARKEFPDKSVWGSGKGEKLEDNRLFLKKILEAINLQVQKWKAIKGVSALEAYIKQHPNQWVKLNIFRGDEGAESFYAKDIESIQTNLLRLRLTYGPLCEDVTFIVEENIDTPVEIGYDGFFNGHNYADKCFLGYERHKNLYVAKVIDYEDLPIALYETQEALAPVLEKLEFRGALSTEEKIVSKKENYFLDICSRLPSPLSALYPVVIKNWAELVYGFGKGEDISLDIDAKYVAAMGLESEDLEKDFVEVKIKPNSRDKVRFQTACQKDGKYYAVRGNKMACILVAQGNSVDEVLKGLQKNADLVEADGIDKDDLNGIDIVKEVIEQGKGVGIDF